jgi:hypothetical protein
MQEQTNLAVCLKTVCHLCVYGDFMVSAVSHKVLAAKELAYGMLRNVT